MQYSWVDLVIIGIVGFSTLTGLFRGFIKEAVALGVWIVGIWAGYNYSSSVTPYLQPYIASQTAQSVLSFVIILFGVVLTGGIMNMILGMIIKSTGLGGMDKILGGAFGFAKGVFLFSLIMAIINMTSLPYQQYFQSSALYPQLTPVINWISGYIPKIINQVKTADNGSFLIDIIPEA